MATRNWRLYTYDLWGNEEDGYEVNDVYRTPEILRFDAECTDAELLAYLESDAGPLNPGECEIDATSDEDRIYIIAASDGHPVCELRAE
jgi:hypothetical protein